MSGKSVKGLDTLESSDPLNNLVAGYPRLSGYIERIPEVAIFRRFAALNTRHLLYLQAELVQLQNELEAIELEDKQSGDEKRQKYCVDWYWLKDSMHSSDAVKKKQWNLMQIIAAKLKEFSK
jgi:hypothetical protein